MQSAQRSRDSHAEDEFSFQMLGLGARWWKCDAFYETRSRQVQGSTPWPEYYPPELHFGYPSVGGAQVLKVLSGELEPGEFAKVIMAFTMDECCTALEEVWGHLLCECRRLSRYC